MSALHDIKYEVHSRALYFAWDVMKHKVKLSALLVLKPRAECYISHKAKARQCFYYFKEFQEKCFDTNMFVSSL